MAGKLGSKVLGKLIGAALFAAGIIFLFFFRPSPAPLPEVPNIRPAKTEVVESAGAIAARSFSGRVQAANRVELSFRVAGPLVQMPIRRGLPVAKGDLLAQIDPRDFRNRLDSVTSRLDQARAQLKAMKIGEREEVVLMRESELAASKAELENARIEMERNRKLFNDQVISKSELDQAVLRHDTAKERTGRAEQNLRQAREGARPEDIEAQEATVRGLEAQQKAAADALEDTSLRAPFDGRVARQHVENFQDVQAGQPIVSLQDASRVQIVADLPESLVALTQKDTVKGMNVRFDALPDRVFEVDFKEIETIADVRTQTFALTVQMDAPEGVNLFPGMPATLQIELGVLDAATAAAKLVPITAIFSDPDGAPHVWRVDPADLSVHRTPVTITEPTGERVSVTQGLEDGDEIVTAGVHFLREGMQVRRLSSQR